MPLPAGVNTVTVTGTYLDLDGTSPASGTVTFRVRGDVWLHDPGAKIVIPPIAEVKTLDAAGAFTALLPANDDSSLLPNAFVYDVTESIVYTVGGVPVTVTRTRTVALPSIPTTADIATLIPVEPVIPSVTPVRTVNLQTPDGAGNVQLTAVHVSALPASTDLFTQPEAELLFKPIGYTAPVSSVNGLTGVVVLTAASVGAVPAVAPATITDPATGTIDTNAALATHFRVTFTGNRTLANPTNPSDGRELKWEITQDGTGGHTLTLGSKFVLGSDLATVVLSTTAGKTDYLGAIYNAARDKWDVLAFKKGH
ncbi:MAG: hypothetical protein M3443_09495 [Actinomycetota bacterium]|nr:hypothetical protein [Actinomycetota bacterium]